MRGARNRCRKRWTDEEIVSVYAGTLGLIFSAGTIAVWILARV